MRTVVPSKFVLVTSKNELNKTTSNFAPIRLRRAPWTIILKISLVLPFVYLKKWIYSSAKLVSFKEKIRFLQEYMRWRLKKCQSIAFLRSNNPFSAVEHNVLRRTDTYVLRLSVDSCHSSQARLWLLCLYIIAKDVRAIEKVSFSCGLSVVARVLAAYKTNNLSFCVHHETPPSEQRRWRKNMRDSKLLIIAIRKDIDNIVNLRNEARISWPHMVRAKALLRIQSEYT